MRIGLVDWLKTQKFFGSFFQKKNILSLLRERRNFTCRKPSSISARTRPEAPICRPVFVNTGEALARQRDIVVPSAVGAPRQWHRRPILVAALRDGGDMANCHRDDGKRSRREGAQTLLISAEDLCTLGVPAVAAAARRCSAIPPGDHRVLCAARVGSCCFRAWQEDVKHTTSMTLPEYVLGHLRNPESVAVLQYRDAG